LFHVERMNSFVILVFLLLIGCFNVYADGWWLTIPSASSGCNSLTSESYFWDTQDSGGGTNSWNGTIPRGDYGIDIKQYFCTGYVDSMPVGSYCFYQNRQNGITFLIF